MSKNKKIASYKEWDRGMTAEEVYEELINFTGCTYHNGRLYWLEARPSDKGRTVLCTKENGNQIDITPDNFYIRTRVHEMGGQAFTFFEDYVLFVNFSDQRIYLQNLNGREAVPITPEKNKDGSLGKYAALTVSPNKELLVFVYEKEFDNKENENYIAALDLKQFLENEQPQEPAILVQGNDFYSDPVFSPDGTRLVWTTWNHPYMPWDQTTLEMGKISGMEVSNIQKIAGTDGSAIMGQEFSDDGTLYFTMDLKGYTDNDYENWWNIYRFTDSVKRLTSVSGEFGEPMWVLGTKIMGFVNHGIISSYFYMGKETMCIIDKNTGEIIQELDLKPFDDFGAPVVDDDGKKVYVIASSPSHPTSLLRIDLTTGDYSVVKSEYELNISNDNITVAKHISFPTSNGETAYAYYYPPKNETYTAPKGEKPPAIVKVHGGPTGRTSPMLGRYNLFWTTQGYAIIDIEHRGGTGYGRAFRDKLLGQWGIVDAEDIKAAVDYCQNEGLIGDKTVIRGGSAGGYAVQRALTRYPDLFDAGGSYYGIGNLKTLAKLTHKFESRYLDRLIGASLEENEKLYEERSPVNQMDYLKSPMILFQGLQDKIVTPENSQEIAEILKDKGIEYEYIEYEEEGHGFRDKKNQIYSLKKEAEFYKKVLFDS